MSRKLAANVWVGEEFFAAGSTPPKDVAEQITNPKAWGDSADAGDESGASQYGDMKVADIKAEIEKRNEGRDDADLLSTDGKKDDLVAVLEADDAASA